MTIEGEFYPSRYPDEGEHYSSYRIEALIDEDPSGRVYRALDSNFSRPVRLKVFSDPISQASSFIDILRIQMQAAAGLNLPGLSELYELGHQGNQVFLATEWGKGAWLSRLLIHRGKFPLEEAIDLITKCAEVLQTISNNHIFHGNLKTSNLMLLTTGDVKVADTGFASAARTAFGPTNLAAYLGTANFLAPEMVESGAADFRADIYSLGMIFHYLLFQAVPFRYEGQKLTVQSDEPNAPIYTDVLDVISRMTERNPQKRYQNYENLIEHLRHLRLIHMQVVKIPAVANLWGAGIKTQNLFKLLCAVFVSGISGVLTVTREDVQRKFYLRNRQLVFFESNQIGDSIWSWLVKKKEMAEQNKPDDADDFQIALNRIIAKQFIRLEDFKFRYEELMNRVLADVLKWTGSMDVEFANADIHNEPLANVSLSEILLRAARQTIDFREVKRELRYDSLLRRTALFQTLIPEFQLNMEERSVAALTQDALHVGGLMKNPDADEKPLRFLYLLAQIGTLEVGSLTGSGRFNASDFVKEPLMPPLPEGELPPLDPPVGDDWDGPIEEDFSNPDDPVRPEVQRTVSQISIERLDAEAESRFQMAQENYDNGKFWQAARFCELALGIHEDSRYYLLMGHSYAHHPKFRNKAEDCFHKAIHLDPLNVQIHLELAKFYVDVGLALRAKTHYEKALSIVNDLPEAVEALKSLNLMELGVGGCPCEHKPGCHHGDHKHHHHD